MRTLPPGFIDCSAPLLPPGFDRLFRPLLPDTPELRAHILGPGAAQPFLAAAAMPRLVPPVPRFPNR